MVNIFCDISDKLPVCGGPEPGHYVLCGDGAMQETEQMRGKIAGETLWAIG